MIRDQLIPALKEKYGNTFEVGDPSEFIAIFPAKHEKVGRLMVYESKEYLTFVIEKVAHDHVYFDPNEDQEKIDHEVTAQAMTFLDDLFSDRVLMGLAKNLMGTSMMVLNWGEPKDFMQPGFDYFLWSGPIGDVKENSQK